MEIDFNITDESIEENIIQEIYIQAGFKTVICVIVIRSGAEIVGSYSPISTSVSIIEGKKLAREDAKHKIKDMLSAVHQWQYYLQEEDRRVAQEQAMTEKMKTEEKTPKKAAKKKEKELVKK